MEMSPAPPPLEPTLSSLIVVSYEGTRDEAGRLDTLGSAEPSFARFSGGHSYSGSFARGMMNGRGTYTWADGTKYEGEFSWNTIEGRGTFSWGDGSTYEGDLKAGLRDGEGTFLGSGGVPKYMGSWRGGKRHGKGTLWYDVDRDCYYEGEWQANQRHGVGSMRYKPSAGSAVLGQGNPRKSKSSASQEGNLYVGNWDRDLKCGEGTMHWFDRREKYVGCWAADQPEGKGEHIWIESRPDNTAAGTPKLMCNKYVTRFPPGMPNVCPTESVGSSPFYPPVTLRADGARFTLLWFGLVVVGRRYTGDWVAGERHGVGSFMYANGARYDGAWAHGAKHGLGVFTFEDGHVYEGPFSEDRMVEPDAESPLRGPDATMQPQLRLHTADLVPAHFSDAAATAERLALEKTVLR